MLKSFYDLKDHITTNNLSSYCTSALSSLVKNSVATLATIVAKSVIHSVRFVVDAVSDVANIVLNTIRTPAESDDVDTKIDDVDAKKDNVDDSQDASNDHISNSSLDWVKNTWAEKDSTYLGEVSEQLGKANYALAKSVIDVIALPYTLVKSSVSEIAKIPGAVNKDALEYIYKLGCEEQESAALQANLTETEDAEECIKLSYKQGEYEFDFNTYYTDGYCGIEDNSDAIELQNVDDLVELAGAAAAA